MTDIAAPSSWLVDLQIPSLLRRWDGRLRPTPLRVPELASVPAPEACRPDEHLWESPAGEGHRRWTGTPAREPTELQVEWLTLESQLPGWRRERVELQSELADLRSEIATLRSVRDQLLEIAVPLNAEVMKLESRQDELMALRSEIQSLRARRSLLQKSLADVRGASGASRRSRNADSRTFHDS
jgi:prefoldin subunit 5